MSGFKSYSCIVLLVSLALASLINPGSSIVQFICYKWHVHVVNGLSSGRNLLIHCQSRDDDLGEQDLAAGASFGWKFRENCIGRKTRFWCYMRPESGKPQHNTLDVFWTETKHSWLSDRCAKLNDDHTMGSKDCIWTAKDDGIYLRNVNVGQDEFVQKWKPGWTEF